MIELELEEGKTQLVVDAFLTDTEELQTIEMQLSAPYFDNSLPEGYTKANPLVYGPNQEVYSFTHKGNGVYQYDPATQGKLDSVGFTYRLEFTYQGVNYQSTSTLQPVPPIDSMTVAFEEAELGAEEGYYTQFWARDFEGRKDYYWIKPFRNGEAVYADDPSFVILSEDAAFGGEGADGFIFILPLRAIITDAENPFVEGDVSSVQLYSLNEDVYEFLDQVVIQSTDGGLFSTPVANIQSTIKDASGQPQSEVLGVFSLSAVSKDQIIIE